MTSPASFRSRAGAMVGASALTLAACSGPELAPPPHDLWKRPQLYDGRTVRVSGRLSTSHRNSQTVWWWPLSFDVDLITLVDGKGLIEADALVTPQPRCQVESVVTVVGTFHAKRDFKKLYFTNLIEPARISDCRPGRPG